MHRTLHLFVFALGLVALTSSAPRADESEEGTELRSALLGPLYLGEEPPELRTLGAIWLDRGPVPEEGSEAMAKRERARRAARELSAGLRAGGDWYAASTGYSVTKNRMSGSVFGTVSRGMLIPDFDRFLFGAEIGDVSEPVENEYGVFVLKRLETRAGCRMIVVRGNDGAARAKMDEIRRLLDGGADFAELARERSEHPGSAGRGGQWAVYERGTNDSHVKLAAFRAGLGEVVGPYDDGSSLYLVKRVPPAEIDPELAENNWIRARAILLAYDNAPEGLRPNPRDANEAVILGRELRRRIEEGESMADLANEFDDDPTGRERGGDLGWIHRSRPGLPGVLDQLWTVEVGALSRVVDVKIGMGLLRREG